LHVASIISDVNKDWTGQGQWINIAEYNILDLSTLATIVNLSPFSVTVWRGLNKTSKTRKAYLGRTLSLFTLGK